MNKRLHPRPHSNPPAKAKPAKIDLSVSGTTGKRYVPFLIESLHRAAAFIGHCPSELSVALVGRRRMADLHERFLGIPGPTDVLTFELDHDHRGRVISGEVVVCVPIAQIQAQRAGHSAEIEILLYVIHGLLHLTGFDDLTEDGYLQMHRKEDSIMKRLGLGSAFFKAPTRIAQRRLSGGRR